MGHSNLSSLRHADTLLGGPLQVHMFGLSKSEGEQHLQAGSCIDLTEQDDDDEPVLIGSARSSSPVLVQQRKAQQPSLPSAEKLHKRKRDSPKRQSCGICMEPLKTMACGPCG